MLIFYNFVDCTLVYDHLEINTNCDHDFNSSIFELKIAGYNYKLDKKIVRPLVFNRLRVLNIGSTIKSIDGENFKNLNNLSYIELNLKTIESNSFT